MSNVATITLNNGVQIPQLGFGTFLVPVADAERVVSAALETGYRSIDTAAAYQNEAGVGRAVAASGLPRAEIFVTTKVWNSDHGYDEALRAFDHSVQRLGLDIVDLYLIHWPVPIVDRYVETWRALEKLAADGRVRAIGVSNFTTDHLQLGNVVIPKSVTPERIRENIDLFGFQLSAEDLAAIADLETGQRVGPDPAEFNLR